VSTLATTEQARRAFAAAASPHLAMLVGRHRAEFVGDRWWRQVGPQVAAAAGMPGWWGKQFAEPAPQASVLEGHNLLRRGADLVASFPMRARVAESRTDGLPALVVSYPSPAPWQWRQVTDELRPWDERTLVGLTFTTLPTFPAGLPFLLHRDA
jgi:hypothetical protein